MTPRLLRRIARGVRQPRLLARRLETEWRAVEDRWQAPRAADRLGPPQLLRALGAQSQEQLWARLGARPYFARGGGDARRPAAGLEQAAADRLRERAEAALGHRVDLLGSGPVWLGNQIDWHRDFKTGQRWPPAYFRDIEYANLDRPSDVKVPWELSRLQWLIPVGQRHRLAPEERYAEFVRDTLDNWMSENPYGGSVNWTCTMEVALRILTWTWLFHAFHRSQAWQAPDFRHRFLRGLYLHARFTERHLERSDINGNHFTADAAGLVFAGLFFGQGAEAERWSREGWRLLRTELPRQVGRDGVDFEASVPYHRLVQELFLYPALYRTACGLAVEPEYGERMLAMARFTAAYSRPDGSVPLWGDADDARALPLGTQALNDHRYLIGLAAVAWKRPELAARFSGAAEEHFWILGPEAGVPAAAAPLPAASTAFPDGGFFVMRNAQDHVFIDCGPVGLAGRGGHGHNDCLSFEAALCGKHLVSDCGAFVYTASAEERNRFRSTACHNTPRVDGQEINRLVDPLNLWALRYDAVPEVRNWTPNGVADVFEGAHRGYARLPQPLVPVRRIRLEHQPHRLTIEDTFEGSGEYEIEVPLHLAPAVEVLEEGADSAHLRCDGVDFRLHWGSGADWQYGRETARISPSYGRVVPSQRLVWRRRGEPRRLTVTLQPWEGS